MLLHEFSGRSVRTCTLGLRLLPWAGYRKCGCSSVVERQLPKLNVVGSSPIIRLCLEDFYGKGLSFVEFQAPFLPD